MKNQELDKKRPTLVMMGMMASLSLTLCAFNWQTPARSIERIDPLDIDGEHIEWDLPPVVILKSKPEPEPAAPAPTASANPSSSRDITLVPDLTPMTAPEGRMDALANLKPLARPSTTLKKGIEPKQTAPQGIRQLKAHELPYIRTCGSITDPAERFQCTQLELKKHVASSFKVPSVYEMADLPSRIQVLFVIDEYGRIREVDTEEEQSPIIMRELERVLSSSPEMVAATVGGQRIKVRFELPIIMSRIK